MERHARENEEKNAMGNVLHPNAQPKEMRVMYISVGKGTKGANVVYPIGWPVSFLDLQEQIKWLTGRTPKVIRVEDGVVPDDGGKETGQKITVCNEMTYQALVPRHVKVANDSIDLYYLSIHFDVEAVALPPGLGAPDK